MHGALTGQQENTALSICAAASHTCLMFQQRLEPPEGRVKNPPGLCGELFHLWHIAVWAAWRGNSTGLCTWLVGFHFSRLGNKPQQCIIASSLQPAALHPLPWIGQVVKAVADMHSILTSCVGLGWTLMCFWVLKNNSSGDLYWLSCMGLSKDCSQALQAFFFILIGLLINRVWIKEGLLLLLTYSFLIALISMKSR